MIFQRKNFSLEQTIDVVVRFAHDRSSLKNPPKKLNTEQKNLLKALEVQTPYALVKKIPVSEPQSNAPYKSKILYLAYDMALRSDRSLDEKNRWDPILKKLVNDLQRKTKRVSKQRTQYLNQEKNNWQMLKEIKRLLSYQKNEIELTKFFYYIKKVHQKALHGKPSTPERLHIDISKDGLVERLNYWIKPGKPEVDLIKQTQHVRFNAETNEKSIKNPGRHSLKQRQSFFKSREKIIGYIQSLSEIVNTPGSYQRNDFFQKISRLLGDILKNRHALLVSSDIKKARRDNKRKLNYPVRYSARQALEAALKSWREEKFYAAERNVGEALKALSLRLQEIESFDYYKAQGAAVYSAESRMADPLEAASFYWLPAMVEKQNQELLTQKHIITLILQLLKSSAFEKLNLLTSDIALQIKRIHYAASVKSAHFRLVELIFKFKLKNAHQFENMKRNINYNHQAFSIYDIKSYENHLKSFIAQNKEKHWYKTDISEQIDEMLDLIQKLKSNPLIKNYQNTLKVAQGRSKLDDLFLESYITKQKAILEEAMKSLQTTIRQSRAENL